MAANDTAGETACKQAGSPWSCRRRVKQEGETRCDQQRLSYALSRYSCGGIALLRKNKIGRREASEPDCGAPEKFDRRCAGLPAPPLLASERAAGESGDGDYVVGRTRPVRLMPPRV